MNGPNRGPQGKDDEGELDGFMPEEQERYEEEGASETAGMAPHDNDLVIHETSALKSDSGDHTPDNSFITHAPRIKKPDYGKSTGRGNGGLGL